MNTWKTLLLGIVLGLFLSGAILLIAQPPRGEALVLSEPPTPQTTIVVYIAGAVMNPGIYTLSRPARVNDAVEAAGGLIEISDRSSINLAAKIEDGAKIIVPAIQEATTMSSAETLQKKASATPQFTPTIRYPININSADLSLLDNLPGIGETKAEAIVIYRQEHGPFKKIEDIMNVPGIGAGLFNSIKGLITIDQVP
jgi:competence protein ComEA